MVQPQHSDHTIDLNIHDLGDEPIILFLQESDHSQA
jgi:hypothetical protein